MRKFVLIIALVAMLIALDAVANDLRFTTGLVLEFREFVRLVNRFIGTALG